MLGKLAVCLIQLDFITTVLVNTCLEIVALNDPGNAAEVSVGIYVSGCPAFLVHREKSLDV